MQRLTSSGKRRGVNCKEKTRKLECGRKGVGKNGDGCGLLST